MKDGDIMSVGIICEYNPFHNGHLYHINKIKELFKDEQIILVLSGNYTQRGDISIIEKYDKAYLSLYYGVDLVVELPFTFATQSSDYFAKGSIELLNKLNCKYLVFGSESNDIDFLNNLADIQINNQKYEKIVKEELDKGENYPTATSNALKKISNKIIKEPNDLLALSYIKEIKKNNYQIKPIPIKRTNDYNSIELSNNIASAKSIREAIKNNKEIKKYVPKETLNKIIKINENNYFNLLKYKINSESDLSIYNSVDEGIENKLKKEINNSNNLEELILKIKSKRYTYNKIKRMFIHILCSYTKEENKNNQIQYIRVLGFSSKGREYLNKLKKNIDIPIITNINKDNIDLLKIELKADNIYNRSFSSFYQWIPEDILIDERIKDIVFIDKEIEHEFVTICHFRKPIIKDIQN